MFVCFSPLDDAGNLIGLGLRIYSSGHVHTQ